VTTIPSSNVQVTADGASSLVDLGGLSSWIDNGGTLSTVAVPNGGSVLLGAATAMTSVQITLSPTGTVSGGTLHFNSGSRLTGTGTLSATANSSNLVSPGTSPGSVTIAGNYTQNATASLTIELGGSAPGTQYDQLVVQGTVALAGNLNLSRTYTPSDNEVFVLIDNDGADPISGTFTGLAEGAMRIVSGVPFQVSYTGGDGNDVTLTRLPNVVLGRRIFYNQSAFDGQNPAASSSDDSAIATDKSAYRPGSGTASFANITSFTRGINGVMIDLASPHGTITAADFSLKIGNNNSPSTWSPAPAPLSVTVRSGAGTSGSDRIELVWSSGAIANTWLQVQLNGNDAAGSFNTNTGMPASDVFFFGNRVGDTGSGTATLAVTSALDELAARGNAGSGATVTNLFDFDRSGFVTAVDFVAARTNLGTLLKINLTNPPAVPEAHTGNESHAIAAAMASVPASAPASTRDRAILDLTDALALVDDDSSPAIASAASQAPSPAESHVERTLLDDALLDAVLDSRQRRKSGRLGE
jgi:hypothetical protein